MPELPEPVRPGDLVTAQMFNQLRLLLQGLDARVAGLEAAQGEEDELVILRILPTGTVETGDEMTLIGRNFGVSDENTVHIAGVRVRDFKTGSDDTVLIFDVPPIAGLAPEGDLVQLTLSNPRGFVSEDVFVVPGAVDVLAATLTVTYQGQAEVGELTPGEDHVLLFDVHAVTTRDATYGLTATVDQGWPAVVVDDGEEVISPPTVDIPHSPQQQGGIDLSFGVRVSIPSETPADTPFLVSFGIMAVENPTQAGNQTVSLTAGEEPAPPSTEVVLTLTAAIPPGQLVGDTVQVPADQTAVLVLDLAVENAGEYEVQEPTVDQDPDDDWTAELALADPSFSLGDGDTRQVQMTISPTADAPSAILRVRVDELDSTGSPTGTFGELIQPIARSG